MKTLLQFLSLLLVSNILTLYAAAQNSDTSSFKLKKGYFNYSGLGINAGNTRGAASTTPYSAATDYDFQTVNGYRFTNCLSAGVGLGLETPFYNESNFALNAFAEMRIDLLKNRLSPFFVLDFGGAFPLFTGYDIDNLTTKETGSTLLGAGFGLRRINNNNNGFAISLGYWRNGYTDNATYDVVPPGAQKNEIPPQKYVFSAFSIRFGWMFW